MGPRGERHRDGGGDAPTLDSTPHARHFHDPARAISAAHRQAALVPPVPQLPRGGPAQGVPLLAPQSPMNILQKQK